MNRRRLLVCWIRQVSVAAACLALAGLPASVLAQDVDAPDIPDFSEGNADAPQEGFEVGDIAPEIEGEDIDGVRFKLSDYRGKVVMIDFWGDW